MLQGFDNDNDKLNMLKKLNLHQASNVEEIFKTNDLIITFLVGKILKIFIIKRMQFRLSKKSNHYRYVNFATKLNGSIRKRSKR